jgi:hypothetical protein
VPGVIAAALPLASVLLLLLARPGLVGFTAEAAWRSWIAGHPVPWRAAALLVGVAMVGLGVFFVWWAARLRWSRGVVTGLLVVACTVALDLLGLCILAFADAADAAALQSLGNLFAVGLATPLYSACFMLFLRLGPHQTRLTAWLVRVDVASAASAVVA